MTTPDRPMPPLNADERATCEAWLDFYRATLVQKCTGLTDDQLRQASVAPSPITLLGLLQHAAEVERNWFRRVLAQEDAPPIFDPTADPDGTDGGFDLTGASGSRRYCASGGPRPTAPGRTARPENSTAPARSWAAESPCAGSTRT